MAADTWDRRPPMPIRMANVLGDSLRMSRMVSPLTESSLLAAARRKTGRDVELPGAMGKGFALICDMLDRHPSLTFTGRYLVRHYLLSLLTNRAKLDRFLEVHPKVSQTPVCRPIMIAGMARTGTTLLHNLLALDPSRTGIRMWEAMSPIPDRDDGQKDGRERRAALSMAAVKYGLPALQRMHAVSHDSLEECTWLLTHTFMSPVFQMVEEEDQYETWLWQRSREEMASAYRYYRLLLQVLGGQVERNWILKSPVHLFGIEGLLEVFPDAHIVRTHRDPNESIPSGCSLFALYRTILTSDVDAAKTGRVFLRSCVESLKRGEILREHPATVDVRYTDLVKDPIAVVREIYHRIGEEVVDEHIEACEDWLKAHPKNKHGVHRYNLASFGLTSGMMDEAFGDYRKQYNV